MTKQLAQYAFYFEDLFIYFGAKRADRDVTDVVKRLQIGLT